MTCGIKNLEWCDYPTVRITEKLLKIGGYMLQEVWQALNCLFIHATFCVIATGASQGKQKMKVGVRKNDDFFSNCGSNNWKLL